MKRIHFSLKKCIWFGSACLTALLAWGLQGISGQMTSKLESQQMATRWSNKNDVAQISCFFAAGSGVSENEFQSFEHSLDAALQEASITLNGKNSGARLWVDAYSAPGQITISTEHGLVSTNALGVGGDFFLFHPMKLLSGSFLLTDDINKDYCMLDQDSAWQLFGANDVAGKMVYINEKPFIVAGVVERPTGKLYEAAGLAKSLVYMPYETLKAYGMCGEINHYEILMPNPVDGFALDIVKNKLNVSEEQSVIVNNTKRYTFFERLKMWKTLSTRSMNTKAVIYPYWENIARYYEDILARLAVLILFLLSYSVLVVLGFIIYGYKHKPWTAASVIRKIQDRFYDMRTKKGIDKKKGRERGMKKNWKKFLCMTLVFAMIIGMCACGKKKGGEDGKPGSTGGKNNPNAALAKENVFRESDINLNLGEDFEILSTMKKDGRIYVLASSYNYNEETGTSQRGLKMASFKEDGSDVQTKEFVLPEFELPEGVSAPANNGGTVDKPVAIPEVRDLDDIMPVPDEGAIDDDFNEKYDDVYDWSYNGLNYAAMMSNGNIIGIRSASYEHYEGKNPENNFSMNGTYIDCWDIDGNLIYDNEFDMSQYQNEDSWAYVQKITSTKSGKTALIFGGDTLGVAIVDENGNAGALKKLPAEVFQNTNGMIFKEDGTGIVTYFKGDDWSSQYICVVDVENGTVSKETKIPDTLRNQGLYNMYSGASTDIAFSSSDGVYTYSIGDSEAKKMMDFVNSDVNATGFDNFVILDDNHFLASYYNYDSGWSGFNRKLSMFTYVKPEDVVEKQVITLASMYLDYNLKGEVIKFNKNSNEYRVVIRQYDKYNTEDDYMAGYTQLNNDFIGGNAPDLICLEDSAMPISSYVKKGLLVNIDDMIKNDPELSKLEYLQNVFDAYRTNGKLYRVVPAFSVQTFVGKKSIFGDKQGITLADVKAIMQKYPEANLIEANSTKDTFLRYVMQFGGKELVDLEKGNCYFDSQYFMDLLEFTKSLKLNDEYGEGMNDEDWEEYWNNYEAQYRTNKTLLRQQYLYGFSDLKYLYSGVMGEEVSFVGFPTEKGTGSILYAYSMNLGIYSKSANVDGAWAFVRQFLTEEYQQSIVKNQNGLPVLKSALLEASKIATERSFWYDENGEKQYIEEEYDTTWVNGQEVPLKPLTQAQVDKVVDFICSVKNTAYYDEEIINIVVEEAAPFFDGKKKAKDVADVIQGRVKPYVNENM